MQEPSRLLVHPCCTSAYFRLLTLGLRYCRRIGGASLKSQAALQVPVSSMPVRPFSRPLLLTGRCDNGILSQIPILFGRLLLAALHWFTSAPTFYQHSNASVNELDADAVQTFAAILEVNMCEVVSLPPSALIL